ncbi:hypothetical protein HWV62_28419 [Athelia sp. TMB]|nr:hypothetical protein HWV62_28419 [Athelia sp. TMB]
MPKKPKDDAPNASGVANRDILQRLSFLYQASVYLAAAAPHPAPIPSDPQPKEITPKAKRRKRPVLSTADLARSYVRSMRAVGQKTTTKMDPSVKRTLCGGCSTVLLPGTATVRVKPMRSHGHGVTYTCAACGTARRIPAPPTLPAPAERAASESAIACPEVDAPMGAVETQRTRRKKKAPVPRVPPLFARDAGHVVFVGNERLDAEL